MGITVNHAGLTSTSNELRSNSHENEPLRLVHHPLPKSAPVEYLSFCVKGKLSQMGRGGLMVVKGTEQQKVFLELVVFAMLLETLPEFKDIYDGTFPNSLHEDASYCTMLFRPRQRVSPPIELSIASIPEDDKDPKVIFLTVNHSNLLTTHKDSRANHYINKLLSLKSHLPGSVPLEHLSFCVTGKFRHLAQGNRGLVVVKGSNQQKIFEKLGLLQLTWKCCPISGICMAAPCLTTCMMRYTSILIYPSAPW
ncbi:hypothetical protein TNCV_2378131 [Trichonephila clavipes]|nr:hypothetical protein TNCV_2378131 [Trichonephila clavipes]